MIKLKLFEFNHSKPAAPPVEPAADVKDSQASPDETQVNATGKRVLIVDDDRVFQKLTAMKLQSAGLRVRTASDSSEAIAALGEEPADAILMDITFQPDVCNGGMGSWDGFQLMTWLRGNPGAKGARFIMVTNSDSAADRQRAQQLGATAYFQKPLDPEQLIALVNAAN